MPRLVLSLDGVVLREVGLSVGSDVPFFLGTGAAWARGRGERLREEADHALA